MRTTKKRKTNCVRRQKECMLPTDAYRKNTNSGLPASNSRHAHVYIVSNHRNTIRTNAEEIKRTGGAEMPNLFCCTVVSFQWHSGNWMQKRQDSMRNSWTTSRNYTSTVQIQVLVWLQLTCVINSWHYLVLPASTISAAPPSSVPLKNDAIAECLHLPCMHVLLSFAHWCNLFLTYIDILSYFRYLLA